MDRVIAWARRQGVEIILPHEFSERPERDPRRDFGGVATGTPSCVLRPATVADLAATLRGLAEQRQPYRLRGAGFSSGGQVIADGGVVVDLTRLDRIVSDRPEASEITVEAGATWLAVGARLRQTGRRPLAMPDNPHMTIGGALAIAEIGDTGSVHGSVISQVQRLTVVTPDGEVHRVREDDRLFRLALGGAGLTGAIAEATIRTMVRAPTLWARIVAWRDLNQFVIDAQGNCDLRLYEVFQGKLGWAADAPIVYQLVGNFADAPRAGEAGLYELKPNVVTGCTRQDRFETLAAPIPWNRPRPGLVLYLPVTAAAEALRLLAEFIRREPTLKNHIETIGLMVMKTDERFPLAPWPAGTHAAVVVVRPSFAAREAASTAEPLLRTAAARTLELGGKIGHGSIDLGLPNFTELQLGGALEELRRLRAAVDPMGLCNRGVFPGLDRD